MCRGSVTQDARVCHGPAWPPLFWGGRGIRSLPEHEAGVHSALGAQKCSWVFVCSYFSYIRNISHWRFLLHMDRDIPNKLSSFNLLLQSFLYLLGYQRSSSYSVGQNGLWKAFPRFSAKFYQFFSWRNHLSCLPNSIHSLRRDLWFS